MTYVLSEVAGDVLLIGGGANNIGDEAILSGLLKDLNEEINTLTIVAHNPQRTMEQHRHEFPENTQIRPMEPTPSNLFGSLFTHDNFVVGGGGLFSRYMGSYSKLLPAYFTVAKAMGKGTYWTAVGVYPSTPTHVMAPLKFSMNIANSVTVRDPISKSTLEEANVRNVELVPDPATTLEPDSESAVSHLVELGIDPTKPLLGVAARRVKNAANNQRLQAAYGGVIQEFQNQGWQIVLLPFGNHPFERVEMDHKVCENFSEEFRLPMAEIRTPQELLGIVNQLDGLVATRLHSMIFAHVVDTPFVAVEYADKVTSLLSEYDHVERGVRLSSVNEDNLIEKLETAMEGRAGERQEDTC